MSDEAGKRARLIGLPDGDGWLTTGAALLAAGPPVPTPFLVEDLIVDRAVAALHGKPKGGKTWLALELALSVATGCAALGRFAVNEPGPVIVVLEESGEAALARRLDRMRAGHGVKSASLEHLHVAANRRVRLDEVAWQDKLLTAARRLRPRLVVFDPLARLIAPGRDENEQTDMAEVLDFMRRLRDEAGAAVLFVHHEPHDQARMRGTSDLEAYWESKLHLKVSKNVRELRAEHREAERRGPFKYRHDGGDHAEEFRLALLDAPGTPSTEEAADARVLSYVWDHPGARWDEVVSKAQGNDGHNRSALRRAAEAGTVRIEERNNPDGRGRSATAKHVYAASTQGSEAVSAVETVRDGPDRANGQAMNRPDRLGAWKPPTGRSSGIGTNGSTP